MLSYIGILITIIRTKSSPIVSKRTSVSLILDSMDFKFDTGEHVSVATFAELLLAVAAIGPLQ